MSKTIIAFSYESSSEVCDGCRLDTVKLGRGSYIMYNSVIENCVVGRYTSIGPNCSIGAAHHDLTRPSTSPNVHEGSSKAEKVIIGNDVWIGANVVIAQGVKIGDGAVIGANSFINKDVHAYEIVAGTPAKHLRYRVPDITDRLKLTSFAWWKRSSKWIKENISPITTMEGMIKFIDNYKEV